MFVCGCVCVCGWVGGCVCASVLFQKKKKKKKKVFTKSTHIQTEFPEKEFQFPLTALEFPLQFTGSISDEDPSFIGFHNCDWTE